MSGVELHSQQTYQPTLTNLGLRTLGYQLENSDEYSPQWAKGLTEFCEKNERIKSLADRVAVSVFADLYEREGFKPRGKSEAEAFAGMLLEEADWEQKLYELMELYLPTERRELFQTIEVEQCRQFEVPVQSDRSAMSMGPYDEPRDEVTTETKSTEINKYGAQTTLGSEYPSDPTLPQLGIGLARQLNEVITDSDTLHPNYDDDSIVDHPGEAVDMMYDTMIQPNVMLVSGRTDDHPPIPGDLEKIEDKYLTRSEFIIADSDRLGYRVVRDEWDTQTINGIEMGARLARYDPHTKLGFRLTSRQGTIVTNEDAVFRGLCRP